MGNTMVLSQLAEVERTLQATIEHLANFLDEMTLSKLLAEGEFDRDYIQQVASDLRRLLVYCEEGYDACRVVLATEPFRKQAAEVTLYKVYHQCIAEYFSPRRDLWYENSRSAYTGRHSIRFREDVPHSLAEAIVYLEPSFQALREELEYYETDYKTKMMQNQ